MTRRNFLSIVATAAAGLALFAGNANAQQPADVDAVKAAHAAFYAALSARDAKAMGALWANKPYVINIGPRSKAAAVGYEDAVAKYWPVAFDSFAELTATPTSITQVQTDGKLAWVVGSETATGKNKAGAPFKFDTFVTNIFEKDGTKWLMISHHAQIIQQ